MIAIDPTETVDEALDDALDDAVLLDAIIVAKGLSNGGVLAERGTWILGRVAGTATTIIKSTPAVSPEQNNLVFHQRNGELFVGAVRVRTGSTVSNF